MTKCVQNAKIPNIEPTDWINQRGLTGYKRLSELEAWAWSRLIIVTVWLCKWDALYASMGVFPYKYIVYIQKGI